MAQSIPLFRPVSWMIQVDRLASIDKNLPRQVGGFAMIGGIAQPDRREWASC
jgi:hypothetical protein